MSGEHFLRAIKSCQNAVSVTMKLAKKGLPVLSLGISNQSRSGKYIHLVQDVPCRVVAPTIAETLSKPVLPRPDVRLKCPSFSILKSMVEKLKTISHDLSLTAKSIGELELKISTESLKIKSTFSELNVLHEPLEHEVEQCEMVIDCRDLLKIVPCQIFHPTMILLSFYPLHGLQIDAVLDHSRGSNEPIVCLSYLIPNKSD
jgi:hypothetical protein